jgi:integration host factor subunit alpha
MALTKNDIADLVYRRLDLPKSESLKAIEALLEIMKRTLENGEDILISGFGTFVVKDKKERMGRNPRTGETMVLRARRIVRFRPSGILRKRVNRNI